jgi:hypothetical protein
MGIDEAGRVPVLGPFFFFSISPVFSFSFSIFLSSWFMRGVGGLVLVVFGHVECACVSHCMSW